MPITTLSKTIAFSLKLHNPYNHLLLCTLYNHMLAVGKQRRNYFAVLILH